MRCLCLFFLEEIIDYIEGVWGLFVMQRYKNANNDTMQDGTVMMITPTGT